MHNLGRSRLSIIEILEQLSPAGYVIGFYAKKRPTSGAMVAFVRPSRLQGLFEEFRIGLLIGNHRKIWSSLWNTIVPTGNQWKDIYDVRSLSPSSDRRTFSIETEEQIADWRSSVLENVSQYNREFAFAAGPALLERTSFAREAASFYLSTLPDCICNHEKYWEDQRQIATEKQKTEARTMLRSGLLNIPFNASDEEDRAFWSYQIAVYTIILNCEEAVSKGLFDTNTDPHKSRDLAWCIQIMASRIYGHDAWNMAAQT